MYYAGIGSRKTPENILSFMEDIAYRLANKGWILRSGGADGADNAFARSAFKAREENGAEKPEIYLPWPNFNEIGWSWLKLDSPAPWTYDIAEQFHPRWKYLKRGAKLLHARNVHQVLGPNEDSEHSSFVLCWTLNGKGGGGTGQAIRIANGYDIPVYDLFNDSVLQRFQTWEFATPDFFKK